jgi:hypothetical protein
MGRYYSGDIEGKFWFGIQCSTDAEFFGARPCEGCDEYTDSYIDYCLNSEDLERCKDGIENCKEVLGPHLFILDEFFGIVPYYNSEDIIKFYAGKEIVLTHKDLENLLRWYARLELGQKILECLEEKGSCVFTADL